MWTKPLAGAGIFHPVEPDAASAPTIGMHGVDVPRPNNFRRHRQDQSPGQQRRLRGYPLALSGGVGVTQEALFPMMNASENLNAARILVEERPENGNVDASSIMQLCRSAMDSSARTIWLLSDPDSEVRRDRCLSLLMEQLEQQRRFLKINDDNVNRGPNPPPADFGRSSVRESRLTRGPLLRTGRASAASGSMCEVIP
jgi:hypothetical protein